MLRMRVWVKHFILFGSFQLEENWRLVFFIAVIFDPTCLNQEQDKNWSQGLIWAQHIFLEYIQTLNTKSGTNLTLISLAPARTRKPRLRISSTHSEQRNLWTIAFWRFSSEFKIYFQFFTSLLEQQRWLQALRAKRPPSLLLQICWNLSKTEENIFRLYQ